MKLTHLYFALFKIIISVQIIFLFFNTEYKTQPIFKFTEKLFKISIGLFLIFYFNFYHLPMIDYFDKILINLAGYILIFDAFDLTSIFDLYNKAEKLNPLLILKV